MKSSNKEEIIGRYRLKADYHTHTQYSRGLLFYIHGKGTVEENVEAALSHGLEAIGITDHGAGHLCYGMNLNHLSDMRRDVEASQQRHPEICVMLGIEANIINTKNGLDLPNDKKDAFDYINAGYHHGVPRGNMILNPIYSLGHLPSGSTERLRIFNTDMAVRALYENDIFILTHPGDKGPFDIRELARACEARGTRMEINNRHRHMTVDEIQQTMDYDISYVIDSDAHHPSEVGGFEHGLQRALEAGLDISRIVNVEKKEE